jgi:hypothetical protein
VQIICEGELWWGKVMRCKTGMETTEFECEEILGYYAQRYVLTASLEYTSVDQTTMAVLIHESAQTGLNRDFNIGTGTFSPSGKVRSRIYDRWEHPNILEILQEFPTLVDGFDFGVEYDLTGLREFICYYPRKGTYQDNLVVELGVNIVEMEVEEDAEDQATLVYATGGSNSSVKFEENFSDDVAAAYYGTRYEAVVSVGDQKDVTWLAEHAEQQVHERKDPNILPAITVKDDPIQIFGVVKVGDTVRVIIKRGRLNIDSTYRVLELVRIHGSRHTQLTLIDDPEV